jgi:hypothetical protein
LGFNNVISIPDFKIETDKKNVQLLRRCEKFGIKLTMLEFKKNVFHRYKQYGYLPLKNNDSESKLIKNLIVLNNVGNLMLMFPMFFVNKLLSF